MKMIEALEYKKFIVSLSFANYLSDKSGIPKVMMAHQLMYNNNGISYISLFSVKKNILNDKVMLFCKFGLIIDGEFVGIFQMSQIINLLYRLQGNGYELIDLHIHHLKYIKFSLVKELIDSCLDVPIKVYLHDYYNMCAGYNMLKNDDAYCGGNGHSDDICTGCKYYNTETKFRKKLYEFFEHNEKRIIWIAPSITTKNIFIKFYPKYKNRVIIIPHQTLENRYKNNLNLLDSDEKIRVGFLGMPRKHKGWTTWKHLVDLSKENQYSFIVFNSSDDNYPMMEKKKILFDKDNLNAMTDALRQCQIHVAVLWSICPETYSYTCFEAFSANAFIITNSKSGNIADTVTKYGCGLVLECERDLFDLFSNDNELRNLINEYRLNSLGGPLELHENKKIVDLSNSANIMVKIKPTNKPVNYLLLLLLNKIYRH